MKPELEASAGSGLKSPQTQSLWSRGFILLWLSETAIDFGSALMSFALGVWVFQKTGSAEQFSWTVLSAAAPALLMAPFAGALADRFDRRKVIVGSDVATAVLVSLVAVLLLLQRLEVLHLLVFGALVSMVGALRNPAYMAAVNLIVHKDSVTRASGLINVTKALLQVGAPLAAGFLMGAYGLAGIMAIELSLVLAGALAVFGALSSSRRAIAGAKQEAPTSLLAAAVDSSRSAIAYFKGEAPMAALLVYVLLQQSLLALITSMITPMVLSTHSSQTLGFVLTIGAVGSIVGALLMVVAKINRHLMLWVLLSDAALSIAVVSAGLTNDSTVWSVCAFFAMAAAGASNTCAGALWMRKTPTETFGSVFALVSALQLLAICVVMLVGGSLVERVFEPALLPNGAWSQSLGAVFGVGVGRGYGLFFALLGAMCLTASLIALFKPGIRRLDRLVPDRPDHAAPASGTPAAGVSATLSTQPAP